MFVNVGKELDFLDETRKIRVHWACLIHLQYFLLSKLPSLNTLKMKLRGNAFFIN